MPIYEYRCPECGHEQERQLPWTRCAEEQTCGECGSVTERRMSLPNTIVPTTGRDTVLQTLNRENGRSLPGGTQHRPRYERAMAKGLDLTRPVIGRGL